MYSNYTGDINDAIVSAANKLILHSPSAIDIAESLLYGVVLICEGSGGFVDTEQKLSYFDIAIGSAREDTLEVIRALESAGARVPVPGETELAGRVLLFGSKYMLIGVLDPDRYTDTTIVMQMIALAQNTIKKILSYGKMKNIYRIDSLTSIRNRHAFEEDIHNHIIPFVSDYNLPVTFMYIDLNNFKTVNDTLGHDMGDRVLQSVAREIQRITKGIGTLYRLGGDEFCVIVQGKAVEDCEKYARRIQGVVHQAPGGIEVTASIGLATYTGEISFNEVIKKAEKKMYAMKLRERRKLPRANPQLNFAFMAKSNREVPREENILLEERTHAR